MRVDNTIEYHCISNLHLHPSTLRMNASEFGIYQRAKKDGICDLPARSLAKAINTILKKTKTNVDTPREVVPLVLKDAIADVAKYQNTDRDFLTEQLALVEDELQPIAAEIENLKELSNTSAQRWGFSFFAVLTLQYFAS